MSNLMILVSAVLVLSCGQTHADTQSHRDASKRFTPATVAGVSDNSTARLHEAGCLHRGRSY